MGFIRDRFQVDRRWTRDRLSSSMPHRPHRRPPVDPHPPMDHRSTRSHTACDQVLTAGRSRIDPGSTRSRFRVDGSATWSIHRSTGSPWGRRRIDLRQNRSNLASTHIVPGSTGSTGCPTEVDLCIDRADRRPTGGHLGSSFDTGSARERRQVDRIDRRSTSGRPRANPRSTQDRPGVDHVWPGSNRFGSNGLGSTAWPTSQGLTPDRQDRLAANGRPWVDVDR